MKKMHGRALPALAAGLIVGLLICAGCIFGSPQQTPPVNNTPVNDTGVVPITMGSSVQGHYSLEEAEAAIANQMQVNGSPQNIAIYSILGKKTDSSGNAESWIIGTRGGKSATLWVYGHSGLTSIAWRGDLPEQEIDTERILPPEKAISMVYTNDRNTTGYYDVGISNGDYDIQASSGTPATVYRINATTGVLISTHD